MNDFLIQNLKEITIAIVATIATIWGGSHLVKYLSLRNKSPDGNGNILGDDNTTKINNMPQSSDIEVTSCGICNVDGKNIAITDSPNAQIHINSSLDNNTEKSLPVPVQRDYEFKKYSLEEIKKKIRILIIDDDVAGAASLKEYLEKGNWRVDTIKDLDHDANHYLVDSQIICVDIHDVGIALGFPNGVSLLKLIATKYPNKKIILYSAIAAYDDLFEDALRYADKTVSKSSRAEFSSAIEWLAEQLFDGDSCIDALYERCRLLKLIPGGISRKEFIRCIYSAIDPNGLVNTEFIRSNLKLEQSVTQIIATSITQCTRG